MQVQNIGGDLYGWSGYVARPGEVITVPDNTGRAMCAAHPHIWQEVTPPPANRMVDSRAPRRRRRADSG